jgi:hypothetical protein
VCREFRTCCFSTSRTATLRDARCEFDSLCGCCDGRNVCGANPPYDDLAGLDTVESELSDRAFPSIGDSSDGFAFFRPGEIGGEDRVGENGDCPVPYADSGL